MAKHGMNKGVPNCPECGGKGMCDNHKREYLKWVYETARDEYFVALEDYRLKLEERIKQNDSTNKTTTD